MSGRFVIRLAAVVGFLGVVLGAFGAHGLEDLLESTQRRGVWETAVFYHLIHAVVLLLVGLTQRRSRVVPVAFFSGIVLFSGSLYVLAVTGLKWLGAITPLGGIAFLIGWAALGVGAGRAPRGEEGRG